MCRLSSLSKQVHRFKQAPDYFAIAASVFFVVLAEATAGTYLTLFAANRARMSPLLLGVFLSGTAVSSVAVSTWLGRRFDRKPSRVPILLALLATACGNLLLALTTNHGLLVLIGCVLLGPGTAALPQLFALARKRLDRAGAETAERGMALLPAVDSTAWIAGPALGVGLITAFGFGGVFVASALCAVLAGMILLVAKVRAPAVTVSEPSGTTPTVRPPLRAMGFAGLSFTGLSFVVFFTAMFVGSVALSIVVTRDLGGTNGDIGLIFSLSAFLEVVVMLCLVVVPSESRRQFLILSGFILFALYFGVVALAPALWMFVVAQVLRAVAIGLVGGQGVGFFQALMPDQVGLATTLYTNTSQVGSMLSGITAGGWAQAYGYRSLFVLCAALSGIGGVLLQLGQRVRARRAPLERIKP